MKYDLILISTCCNHEYIYQLIESVLISNNALSVCLIVVNQTVKPIKKVINTTNTDVAIIEYGENVNTSVARNIGINYLLKNNLKSHFVGFPDDDSSFDGTFFNHIYGYIKSDNFYNMVTDVYCTGTNEYFRKIKLKNNAVLNKYNFNVVGAVNIILKFETFSKVLYFDERFGVNAKYGAGEDGDYFIRAVQLDPFYYNNEMYSYHPSGDSKYEKFSFLQLRKRLIGYGIGVVALLCKHKMYLQALILTFRALGGVFYYILKLKFRVAFAYFESFFVRLFFFIKFITVPLK